MSITKRGSVESPLIVVCFSYICGKCGHILTVEKDLTNNKCPKCSDGIMMLQGAATNVKSSKEE